MLKKISLLLLSVVMLFSFSSCNSATNLSDMSVAQGVSIDCSGEFTRVCVQFLDLSKGSATSDGVDNNITSVTGGSGENISKAVSNASAGLTGPIFFGQNKIIVFGDEYAKLGLDGIGDYALRAVDSRPDVLVALCNENAEKVIRSKQENAKIPAQSLYDMIKTGERVGLSVCVSVNDLLNMYSGETSDAYLPCISVENEKAACDGIAVFSNKMPVGTLRDREAFGFLLMLNSIKGGVINVVDESLGNVSFEIKSSKIKKSASTQGSTVKLSADIKLKLILNNSQKSAVVKISNSDVKRLERLAQSEVEDLCSTAVKKCFSLKSDALCVGKMLAKSEPKTYDAMKSEWRDSLCNAEFNINSTCKIELISDNSIKE